MNARWSVARLGDVLRYRKQFITIDDLTTYRRPRVQLHAQGVVLRDEVPGALIKTKQQQVCRANEFLVAEIDAKVGGFGIVPAELEGAIVSSHYFLFANDGTRLDHRFLDYFARTSAFRGQVAAQGSTNYAAIRPAHVLGYSVPLPPLDEQRRIVKKIDDLTQEIEAARQLRASTLEDGEILWQATVDATFRGMVWTSSIDCEPAATALQKAAKRFSHGPKQYNNAHPERPSILESGPFEIPQDWVWTTLGSVVTDLVDCINDTPSFVDEDTGLLGLKSTNVRPYFLDLSRKWYVSEADFDWWNKREPPKAGDILLTREAPVGYACAVPDNIRACLTQRLMLVRPNKAVVEPAWLLHFLNSRLLRVQIEEHSRGLTTPHIRVQDAPKFNLPLPPIAVQQLLLSKLNLLQKELREHRRLLQQTAETLCALTPTILDRAFRGAL